MKKILTLMIVLLLIFAAGCQNNKAKDETDTGTKKAETEETTPVDPDEPRAAVTDFTGLEIPETGDLFPNFEAVLCDGTTVSLDGLLEEYDAVFLNIWATWCGPCKNELPFFEETAKEGKVAFVCLAPTDTKEEVSAFQEENGYPDLMMGEDVYGIKEYIKTSCYPTTCIIDKNKTLTFYHEGTIGTLELLQRILNVFTAEDYTESITVEDIPQLAYSKEKSSSSELTAALCKDNSGRMTFKNTDGEYDWPFIADGEKVYASNASYLETASRIQAAVEAEKGEVFAIDYDINTEEFTHCLIFKVNGKNIRLLSGNESGTLLYEFAEAGTYTLEFSYDAESYSFLEGTYAYLLNARLASGNEAEELLSKSTQFVQSLEGYALRFDIIDDNVRALLLLNSGEPVDFAYSLCYAPAESFDGRICIGKDRIIDLFYILDYSNENMLSYKDAYDTDNFGYRLKFGTMEEGYAYNSVYVYSLPDYDISLTYIIFRDIENTGDFLSYAAKKTKCEEENLSLVFADEYYKEIRDGEHGVIVTDITGRALSGVRFTVCKGDSCNLIESDGNIYIFEGDDLRDCKVKVVSAPAGYSFDPEKEYSIPVNENLVIELEYDE